MLGNNYLPLSEIITAAAQELREEEFGVLGRHFYTSAAQRGLKQMNLVTQFFKMDAVLDIPPSRIVELPKDLTGKDYVYLFSGTSCDIGCAPTLWIKPGMFHLGGSGFVSQNTGLADPLIPWAFPINFAPANFIYYAGERRGKLYLSPSCAGFEKLLILYTGIGVECFGEDFEVPIWCSEAITDFVILKAAQARRREDPKAMGEYIADKKFEMNSVQGSWNKAIWDYKKSDKKRRYDQSVTNTRFGRYQ
jgi:hypothetical protein